MVPDDLALNGHYIFCRITANFDKTANLKKKKKNSNYYNLWNIFFAMHFILEGKEGGRGGQRNEYKTTIKHLY